MNRGDIVMVQFDPHIGSEPNKIRPAIIVSNDRANASVSRHQRGLITVVPLSSNIDRVYDFQVLVSADRDNNGLSVDSKAQTEEIRSVDLSRIGRRLGTASLSAMRQLDNALILQLDLPSP